MNSPKLLTWSTTGLCHKIWEVEKTNRKVRKVRKGRKKKKEHTTRLITQTSS